MAKSKKPTAMKSKTSSKAKPPKAKPAAATGRAGLPGSAILKTKESVLFRKEKDVSLFLLNLEDQSIYQTAGISAYLWLLLDGSRTLDEVTAFAQKNLQIKEKAFDEKAREFIREIFTKNLVDVLTKKAAKPGTPDLIVPSELKGAKLRALKLVELPDMEVYAGCGFYTTSSSCGNAP